MSASVRSREPWTHWKCEECSAQLPVSGVDSVVWGGRCTDGHFHAWALVDAEGRTASQRWRDDVGGE